MQVVSCKLGLVKLLAGCAATGKNTETSFSISESGSVRGNFFFSSQPEQPRTVASSEQRLLLTPYVKRIYV